VNETSLPCPYCGKDIDAGTRYDLIKMRKLADHKATCPKKRYLGGELSIEEEK